MVAVRPELRLDGVRGELPARRDDCPGLNAAVQCGTAALVADDVRIGVAEQLVAGGHDQPDADLVAHRAGRHEHRSGSAEQTRHVLFERRDRRILAVHVVADLGIGHRVPHGWRGFGDRVAAEIDEPGHRET